MLLLVIGQGDNLKRHSLELFILAGVLGNRLKVLNQGAETVHLRAILQFSADRLSHGSFRARCAERRILIGIDVRRMRLREQ